MTTIPRALAPALLTHLAVLASSPALAEDGASSPPPVPWEEPAPTPRAVPWLEPNVQLQTWFTAFDQDEDPQADPGGYGDPEHDVGFSLPRARLGFRGGFKVVDFAVRVGSSRPYDAVSPDPAPIDLVDGWARLNFETKGGTTRITLGQHAIPFSREQMMSSNDLVFQERAVSTNYLSPLRDLGLTVRHDWRWIGAAVGVYNGGGNLFGDVDPGLQIAARVEGHVGGDTYRTNSTYNAFGLGASYIYNRTFADTTQRVGVDLLGRIVGLTLQAEGTMNFIDPNDDAIIVSPTIPEVTKRMGGFAQLSYYAVLPLGDLEPAVRFSYLDDATHLQDNGDVAILHGGVSWREPVPFLDVGMGYIHRMELQGQASNNDSLRVWAGIRYPSRKHAPVNLLEVFRGLGAKPLARSADPAAPVAPSQPPSED